MKALTTVVLILLVSPPVQAFFCFSFGAGGANRYSSGYYPPPPWLLTTPAVLPGWVLPRPEPTGLPRIAPVNKQGESSGRDGWRFRPLK